MSSTSLMTRKHGDQEWIDEFLDFVANDDCPQTVKLEYARVKERSESKRPPEATASEECYDYESTADVDDAVKDLLSIVATQTTVLRHPQCAN